MTALQQWAEDLASWAIPQEILDAAPESPWGFPPGLFRRLAESALDREPSATHRRALEALPDGGTVLDVGVGAGAGSLPLAERAGVIVGVDPSREMLESFRSMAERIGGVVETVEGTWPEAAADVEPADVVVCSHVLYNVPDLAPFAQALGDRARRRVVVELTSHHPRWPHNPLWLRFHGIRRPERPTADDAVAALRELGITPKREDRPITRTIGFDGEQEAVAYVRRIACLAPERDPEIRSALGDRLRRRDGGWTVEPPEGHHVVTLWWDGHAPR